MTSSAPPTTTPRDPGRRTGRLVGGILLVVIGLLALASGGTLVGLHLGTRDDDGFYEVDESVLRTPTRALVSESVEVDLGGAWLLDESDLGDIRLRATPAGARDVFVGIGPTADVRRYLAGVAWDEADFDGDDGTGPRTPGTGAPAPPGSQPFWAASAQGAGRQEVVWPVEDGEWSGVVMNADGSPGVDVAAQLGLRTDLGLWVGLGALALGLLLGGIGVALLVSRGRARAGERRDARGAPDPEP